MSVNACVAAPAPTPPPLRQPTPRPRRPHAAGPTSRLSPATEVCLPAAGRVADWSEATIALFADLTALERAVVEWMAAGYSATESYRRAVGRAPASARQSAHQIARRPRVAAALSAALRDRNLAARLDREWLLQKLFIFIEGCEQRGGPRATRRLVEALGLAAKLLGLLPGRRLSSLPRSVSTVVSEPSRRLDDLIAKAEAALGPAVKKTPANASDADQHARTLGLPSAHPATPQPSSIPISVAVGDQLASATGRGRPQPRGYGMVTREPFMGVG